MALVLGTAVKMDTFAWILGSLSAVSAVALVLLVADVAIESTGGVVETSGHWKCLDGFRYRSSCGSKIRYECVRYQCTRWEREES